MNRLELSQIRNVLANTYANLVNGYFNDMDIEFSVMISNLSKELINNLSFVYDLDALEMKGPILNSIKENGLIDKTLLRKSVRNYVEIFKYVEKR